MFTSLRNEIFLKMRTHLRFSRRGYSEIGTSNEESTSLELDIAHEFLLTELRPSLSPLQWKRNLSTLWLLKNFHKWQEVLLKTQGPFLEVGSQDFSRLPALKYFLRKHNKTVAIHGLELDPYPVLSDLHSRWDKAQYYISLMKNQDQFFAGDFFEWNQKVSGILCFFPFVTPGPALSWGLPERFGQAEKWVDSFLRCLEEDGFLFVVHQGDEEEQIFDRIRKQQAPFLKLVERHALNCPFWMPKKPSCASLYVRDNNNA